MVSVKFWVPVLGLVVASTLFSSSIAIAGGGGPSAPRDTAGLVRDVAGNNFWFLRSSNDPTCAAPVINVLPFGVPTDRPIVIDTTGDGVNQIGVFRDLAGGGLFIAAADNTVGGIATPVQIQFGLSTDIPLAGNFDPSTPEDEVGVYRPSTQEFFLDDGLLEPVSFVFGDSGDIPVVGNWDDSADGSDEVGLYRPSNNTFYLREDIGSSAAPVTARPMGAPDDLPVVGDFDSDGRATIGVFRDSGGFGTFFLNNMATGIGVDVQLDYGAGTDLPVMGDWDGPNLDEVGC